MDSSLNKKFTRFLKSRGHLIEIAKDGNCLYSSLSQHLFKTPKRQWEVRATIAREILTKQEEYLEFFNRNDPQGRTPFTEAIEILTPATWGGQMEIAAAILAYKVNVVILHPTGPFHQFPDATLPYQDTIYLTYHLGNHYNLLLPYGRSLSSDETFNPDDWEDEEELDYSSDESEDEDFNEDDGRSEEASLVDSSGYQYLANKVFARGRASLEIVFLIPKMFDKGNLVESILQAGSTSVHEILYYFDYGSQDRWLLQNDEDVTRTYTLYCRVLPLDWNMRNRRQWISYYQLPHLILSAVGYTWHGVKLQMLVKSSGQGLVTKLCDRYWRRQRDSLIGDLRMILDDKDILFCIRCNLNCPYHANQWHLDLSKFRSIISSPNPTETNTLERMSLFDTYEPVPSPVLNHLRELYASDAFPGQTPKLNRTIEILDDNAQSAATDNFSSYLVLVLDGLGMPAQDEELELSTLSDNGGILKMVYAGSCKNENFRTTHFTDASAIHNILTRNSRLFSLRRRQFRSEESARKDEAFVITLLQMYLRNYQNNKEDPPFLLLNARSENQPLMLSSSDEQRFILDFIVSETPIFSFPGCESLGRFDGFFKGNYLVRLEKKIELLPGPYQAFTFEDMRDQYELIRLANDGFTSTKLKRLYSELE